MPPRSHRARWRAIALFAVVALAVAACGSDKKKATTASTSKPAGKTVALAFVGVHRAAGEDPGAAHEALLGIALDEEHLRALGPVAQEDQRSGLPRLGDLALVELFAGRRSVRAHRATLPPP